MPKIPIKKIYARMILDSRGNPGLEVTVETAKSKGVFGVPSGASTGKNEALELRDGGKPFDGLGVNKAIDNVGKIAEKIIGMDVFAQASIDQAMIEMDGTANKSRLGANAILGVSGAVVKAAATARKQQVYEYVAGMHKLKKLKMPKPMFNLINGGAHADTNLDIQEYMVVPARSTVSESVRMASEIFHSLAKALMGRKLSTNLGNEGGYSFIAESNRVPMELIITAAHNAGYNIRQDFHIALDVAASEIYQAHDRQYVLSAEKTSLNSERFTSLMKEWTEKYGLCSIEDPLSEEDWEGWAHLTKRMGDEIMVVGDDLFATHQNRLARGIKEKSANAVIIKPNQAGTITETLETVLLAQKNGFKIIASHRSGETNDDFIADFAVGVGSDFCKFGSVARGERTAKYNRLMQIEKDIK